MNRPPETATDAYQRGVTAAEATMATRPDVQSRFDYEGARHDNPYSHDNHPQPCPHCQPAHAQEPAAA